jgi:hypothetical protein
MRGLNVKQKSALNKLFKLLENESKDAKPQPTDGPRAYLISIVKRAKPFAKKEADSASAMPQMVRAEESQSQTKATFTFAERAKDLGEPSRFKCVLIQEGLGNLRDAFYYSKDALKSAVDVFDGKKIMANHPSESEENERPERDVRDILGHYENVQYEEAKDGRGQLTGEVVIPQGQAFDWARNLMSHSVDYSSKYPGKEFIGLSINASGDANEMPIDDLMKQGVPDSCMNKLQEAKANGIENIKLVTVISDAKSCDLVTQAGADGKILSEI